MSKKLFTILLVVFTISYAKAQGKFGAYMQDGIMTDSSSIMFFPVASSDYDGVSKLSSPKTTNIMVYNFVTEEQNLLLPKDSFVIIQSWSRYNENSAPFKIAKNWVFFKVEELNSPLSNDCRPAIAFVCDVKGNQLKALTNKNENCAEIRCYEKQGFVLLKMQVDKNQNNCFNHKDNEYYYKRFNLKDLSEGKNIVLPK